MESGQGPQLQNPGRRRQSNILSSQYVFQNVELRFLPGTSSQGSGVQWVAMWCLLGTEQFSSARHSQTRLPGPGTTAICWALVGLLLSIAAPPGCHSPVSCRTVDILGAWGPRGGWNDGGGYVGVYGFTRAVQLMAPYLIDENSKFTLLWIPTTSTGLKF